MNNKELWQAALGEIELNISRANFITWFKNTEIINNKDGVAVIAVPNAFSKEWLENKYNKLILRSLRNILPDIKEIEFTLNANQQKSLSKSQKPKKEKISVVIEQSGFQELEADKETNLNPRYTFDNFIVGSFNQLAQAAANAITENLGQVYNPLFIYGGVGLGKTHLLQAIGNKVIEANKGIKIKYVSSDKFTSELVDALHHGHVDKFKNNYRKIDLLIIDDVQFLAGKEKTQEEFFHIFNALYQKNKQIVISSDRPPKAISTLEERLRSRFEGGMIADISYPDFETRMAILKIKVQQKNFEISQEILEYIAKNIQKNIRELEGALNRIVAHMKLNDLSLNTSNIKKILSSVISSPKKITSYKNILKTVADFYDIELSNLLNKSRKKEIVWPRQIAMFLMREELKSSYPFIGEKLGGRDHTTVMYACEKLTKEIETSDSFQQEINLIKERLYNS